jgi:hypothetical protein
MTKANSSIFPYHPKSLLIFAPIYCKERKHPLTDPDPVQFLLHLLRWTILNLFYIPFNPPSRVLSPSKATRVPGV